MDAVLYVVDLERMTAFYRDALGLAVAGEHDGGVELDCDGSSLQLVRVPPGVAVEIGLTDPPLRREDTPIKLVVPVAGLAQARERLRSFGGAVDDAGREWSWHGFDRVDAVDPEGNVVQLRAPARGEERPTRTRADVLRDWRSRVTSSDVWDDETAASYDDDSAQMFAPEVLDPAVDLLAELAGDGAALELAVGTGRVAVPLRRRGVPVGGIELSPAMVAVLRGKAAADEIPVVVGDMARATAPGRFSLVYLVFNSISNLRTQAAQVACFRNAARHLQPGGRFVVELFVPPLRRLPPGQVAVPFDVSPEHTGFDTIDVVTQELTSHHYTRRPDGSVRYGQGRFRYAWPAELDLMASIAGLALEHRWAGWDRSPFTAESESHVSVWRTASPSAT